MAETFLFANNANSFLAGPITAVSKTLTVAPGDGAKFPDPEQYVSCFVLTLYNPDTGDTEIVFCYERTGDVLMVTRAQEGTFAGAFPANTFVSHQLTAAQLEYLRDL